MNYYNSCNILTIKLFDKHMFKRNRDKIYCIIINNKIFLPKNQLKKFYSQIMFFEKNSLSKHIVDLYNITKFKCIFNQIIDYYFIKNL